MAGKLDEEERDDNEGKEEDGDDDKNGDDDYNDAWAYSISSWQKNWPASLLLMIIDHEVEEE